MASNLNTLPMEILLRIAEISTWGVSPSSKIAHPANYARNHASLARTCRWLYEALNGELYKRNLKNDPVTASCLVWAVDVGNLDTVKRAVAHGATLNFQVEVDKKTTYCPPWRLVDFNSVPRWHPFDCPCSFSLLHLAVGRQYVKTVQYLLEQKVDVHAPSRNFCCKGSRALELVELLVTNGAFLVAEGVSAIHELSSHGRNDLVNRFLSRSNPVSLRENFHFAVSKNDFLLVTELVGRVADIADADWEGNTALHPAAKSCEDDPSIIKLLLESRINPAAENEKGQTAFHFACANGNLDVVRMIQQHSGVSATHTDHIDQTSLHYACQSKHPGILHTIELLIGMEVPVGQESRPGFTPLYLALKYHNFDIASKLIAQGCDPRDWTCVRNNKDGGHVFANLAEMTPSSQTELVRRVIDTGFIVNTQCWIPSMCLWTTPLFRRCMYIERRVYESVPSKLVYRLFVNHSYRPPAKKNFAEAEEVIMVALKSEATLEGTPSPYWTPSALEYAVSAAGDGDTALLEILLKHSTAENKEHGYLIRFIRRVENASVREMLLDFGAHNFSHDYY
ncbi:unnamed protein product [Clonostachys chloroleuca]|uniref:Uncharacterized protein n=1 Tax=Clonostachys chloroleuca TaxID=1926264 RepID=A0AA35MBR8_9HYPO|nr:unnamed protein product [Clonostachys chloroleuca]